MKWHKIKEMDALEFITGIILAIVSVGTGFLFFAMAFKIIFG